MIHGFAHVALYTTKFDETLQFYQSVFGARKIGYPHTPNRGCLLQIGMSVLEVFESIQMPDGLFKHIAISCDDVDCVFAQALTAGATAHVEPKDIILSLCDDDGPESEKTVRIAFVKGPSGEQIELMGN